MVRRKPDRFSVEGQVVLVSGASRGIGRAIAEGFAASGAQVLITGRERATLEKTAAEIGAAAAIPCDVAKGDQVKGLVREALRGFKRIDTLINVAGVNRRKAAEDYTEEDYDFILGINLKGAFLLSQEAGKAMLAAGRGSQINVASLNTDRPLRGVLPYAVSKAGMAHMTRALALEWGRRGVRVNALAPGFILTDLTRKLWADPTMRRWAESNTPQGRLGLPEDMVGTAIFLASPAAAFLTGQVIYVDGGFTAGWSWPLKTR